MRECLCLRISVWFQFFTLWMSFHCTMHPTNRKLPEWEVVDPYRPRNRSGKQEAPSKGGRFQGIIQETIINVAGTIIKKQRRIRAARWSSPNVKIYTSTDGRSVGISYRLYVYEDRWWQTVADGGSSHTFTRTDGGTRTSIS